MATYFNGLSKDSNITSAISQVVANEGGNTSHLDLFNYLLKPSFDSYALKDMRCPISLLFTLPSLGRYLLSWRLYEEEKLLDKGKTHRVTHPSRVMLLHASVTSETVSPIYLSFEPPSNIHTLLGLKRIPKTDNVREDCSDILASINQSAPDILLALETYDRVWTLGIIAKSLGYKDLNIQALQNAANYIYA